LSLHGRWITAAAQYAEAVDRYAAQAGQLDFAAPQDWMCEPAIVARTGLSVGEHQERTVASYLELRALAPHLPFIPVVQGWHLADYLACVDRYQQAGVDLAALPLTGLGSVCRRQSTGQIAVIVTTLASLGVRLHGFGIKTTGLHLYGHLLASADSMAWSYAARRAPALPGCLGHRNCANCLDYAAAWRTRILAAATSRGCQASLFDPDTPDMITEVQTPGDPAAIEGIRPLAARPGDDLPPGSSHTRPAASLSTARLRDGATHQHCSGDEHR
jgi:hypothetical protein